MRQKAIGIFDSGVGGLTVFKEIKRLLPEENIIYLGDTARVPYGIRSKETVTRYSIENTEFLLSKGIKLLVIACNTASSLSLQEIKNMTAVPVVGVIEPGARAAVSVTRNKKIGIIGTEATVRSMAYPEIIKHIDSTVQVFSKACPLFVPLVEEGWFTGEVTRLVTETYLGELKVKGIDTLILGCTHYPLLKDIISEVMGSEITLIDSAQETAKVVKKILEMYDLQNNSAHGNYTFYVTDSPERFVHVGEKFLGEKIENIEKIVLKEVLS
ncbi:MAG: glutamate racemase [Thermodesulfovibrionales bacterium]|nr:glutamate racemase [Thermodesulfovibrionales bacterium]